VAGKFLPYDLDGIVVRDEQTLLTSQHALAKERHRDRELLPVRTRKRAEMGALGHDTQGYHSRTARRGGVAYPPPGIQLAMPSLSSRATRPARRQRPWLVLIGLLAIVVGALVVTGTILTLGLLLVPTFLLLAIVYTLWRSRRARNATPVPSSEAARSATERTD
jgi:hypothetical protein